MAGLSGLWAKALQTATINEGERLALASMTQQVGQLQAPADPISGLIALLQQKQEMCQRNRWRVRIGDRDIILRDVAAKIISVLDVFKAVGDAAVQVDPGTAALPWALIRFLLQAAVEERTQMYALLSIVEGVSRISARCRVYELLFVPGTSPNDEAYSEFRDALLAAYAHVLKAIVHAASKLEQRTVKKAWTAIIHPQETSEMLKELERCDEHVRVAAASCTAAQVHSIDGVALEIKNLVIHGRNDLHLNASDAKDDMQALGSKLDALQPSIEQIQQQTAATDTQSMSLHRLLKTMEMPLSRIDERVSGFMQEVDKETKLRILDWVSTVKYGDHHKSASDSRTPGTCDWILQDSRFEDWRASSSSVVLLIYGSPGTGKTYLVSRIVDWVEEGIHQASSDEAFAFFYCKRNEESRRNPLHVIRSMVRQLATPREANERDTIHREIHNQYNKGRETATGLNFSTCRDVLREFIETYPRTTIVLDALDECEKDCRHQLLDLFDDILGHASRPVKLIIASRPDVDIKEHFLNRAFINIRATDNRDDIGKYIRAEVQKHPRWSKLNEGIRTEIRSILLEKSDGMFQWVALQVRQLLRLRTENAIRDRLGRLPKDLKDAYDEIYQEIDNLHSEDKQIANRAFQWVMCAKTPLGRGELLHAVCQDPTSMEYQEPLQEVDETLILDLCHNLLVFDTELHHWRVSHLSVIEYFEENHLHDVRVAHCHVAKTCLSVLMDTSLWPQSKWPTYQAHHLTRSNKSLVGYALSSWLPHILALEALPIGDADPRVKKLLRDFLGEPTEGSPSYTQWIEFVGASLRNLEYVWEIKLSVKIFNTAALNTPIQFVCHFGLFNLLWEWWSSSDLDVNMQFLRYWGAGHAHLVHYLPPKRSWTLLSHAIHAGNYSLSEFLLRRGANPNLGGRGLLTPLEAAADRNSTAAARLLLRWGADINGPECHKNGAIFLAVKNSSMEVLRLLLRNGGNANATSTTYDGSLRATAVLSRRKGSVMVKWLIRAGADVTATSPYKFGSPVAAASRVGDLASLRRLLKAGADPQLHIPGAWGSALAAAAASPVPQARIIKAMRLLIQYGADPNTLLSAKSLGATTTGNALAVAVRNQAVDTIDFLLRNGADVNMLFPGESHCALYVAVMGLRNGHYSTKVMEALLHPGADVNIEGPPGLDLERGHSVLNAVFQLALKGGLYRFPCPSVHERPRWMEAAELLVEYGAALYGDLGKLKVGLMQQQHLTLDLVEGLFCAKFLDRLEHNNDSSAALRSDS